MSQSRPVPTTSQQVAAASPTLPSSSSAIPTFGTDPNSVGGGVWAQTSSKREKLAELLTELNGTGVDTATRGMETLDLAADAQEKLDLEFADGLKLIAKFVDDGGVQIIDNNEMTATTNEQSCAAELLFAKGEETTKAIDDLFKLLENVSVSDDEGIERSKFEATMNEAIRILSAGLPPEPNLKKAEAGSLDASNPLCYMRQFVEQSEENNNTDQQHMLFGEREVDEEIQQLNDIVTRAFYSSTQIYRILLLRATARTLLDNWDTLTTVTSGDIDRAAVSKTAVLSTRTMVKAKKLLKLFTAYANGSCKEWVESWWNLIDDDCDGLLDEEEMNSCVNLAMKPVHTALLNMVQLSLEVCPVRTVGSEIDNAWYLGGEDMSDIHTSKNNETTTTTTTTTPVTSSNSTKKLSWRNRRRELKARAALTKTFEATLARHFRDQVETPHRLRCIYAWADKSHQSNKLDSIVVDSSDDWGAASSIVGRKRYVELLPKISYTEFRNEQANHFPHLDKIGEEITMSFKEDLWVMQGKRRQSKELRRDGLLFLFGISLVDAGIGML